MSSSVAFGVWGTERHGLPSSPPLDIERKVIWCSGVIDHGARPATPQRHYSSAQAIGCLGSRGRFGGFVLAAYIVS